MSLLGLLLSACVVPPVDQLLANASSNNSSAAVEEEAQIPPPDTFGGLVRSISEYVSPTPVPTAEPSTTVVVNTNGARANIRSGPGLDFPIVAKGYPGDAYEVVGRSEDEAWWQICCVTNTEGAATTSDETWVAASVVRLAGDGEDIAVTQQLLSPELSSSWQVDWQCGSDRCEVKQCSATVDATVEDGGSQQMLTINHEVVWDDTCFATDSWIFEVNQFTGRERTGQYEENFLYGYWLGGNPGEANGVYTFPDGRAVAVFCSGPHTVEIEEGGGWTTLYEGNTCHDVRTGILVVLSYNKRWLFTGEFEGQSYDRAYFGDNETLRQRLTDTNLELSFVEKR
ncbi:MAG TPA: SH3 domain-containing protein [Caldilineaceae bacterium]|nr:SH3 domain-containing protein [Caldilineaceae bacterium]